MRQMVWMAVPLFNCVIDIEQDLCIQPEAPQEDGRGAGSKKSGQVSRLCSRSRVP